MASPDSAAKSAAASATSAAASAQAAATALEQSVETVAGRSAASQTYNIENDAGVKGALSTATGEQVGQFSALTAVGDGVTDDSAALQALIDEAAAEYAAGAAFSTREVVVQLPRGHFALATRLSLKTGVVLRGVGRASRLKALTGVSTAVIIGISGDAVTDAVVEDLLVDGGHASGLSLTGIQVTNGSRITVRNCDFENLGIAGVAFQGLNSGGGTPDSSVTGCRFNGIGLADGTTGFGILFKDASAGCRAEGNDLRNIKGGMGIGGNGSAGTGWPLHCVVTGNTIRMAPSATGFEAIGFTAGCDYWLVGHNNVWDSYDNGISCSGANSTVVGNSIDGAWNHGIASAGSNNVIIGNFIRNVGKENAALAFGFISATSTSRNLIAFNRGIDDQGTPTTTHGIKFITSGGNNVTQGNLFNGHTGTEITGNIASDNPMTLTADGLKMRRLTCDIISESTTNAGIAVQPTIGLNGLAYSGSARLGAGQHVFSSNVPATRPNRATVAAFNQAADLDVWFTTASDNTTLTARAGVTPTGRIYSTQGVRTIDLGAVDGKTSAQLDAMFLAAPSDGTHAVGTLSSANVHLFRKGGKWNYSAATQIA